MSTKVAGSRSGKILLKRASASEISSTLKITKRDNLRASKAVTAMFEQRAKGLDRRRSSGSTNSKTAKD